MMPGLEVRLAELAAQGQTTHYGALARDLGLTGAGTIARLTDALERLMDEDAAAGMALRAALVTARYADMPAQGFFAKAAALGFDVSAPEGFVARQRAALYVR